MIKREDLDQLRCEITVIPTRRYNHAARALALAEALLEERDELLAKIKSMEEHVAKLGKPSDSEAIEWFEQFHAIRK